MTLGMKLKEVRHEKKFSLNDLARAADTTPQNIAGIEAGRTKSPSYKSMVLISRALGVPVEFWADYIDTERRFG